jgi:hypothetical protein
LTLALAAAATVAAACLPALARLESWRDESASAFGRAKRERVVVSDTGRVRLGHALKPLGTLEAARVWDLALGKNGEVFAATGDDGKVFRRAPGDGASWSLAFDAADTQALSLATAPNGHVFVGTGPSGRVVDVTDPKHPASRPGPGVQYVWDLATDASGNLYAATGPNGQLWKRDPEGNWSLVYDSKHNHLLSVAVTPDGTVYAGSDGEGLVYKVAPDRKVSVLYDAPQNEVRTLIVGPDGTVFAGTAAESGGGSGRGPTNFPGGGGPGGGFGGPRAELSAGPGGPRPAQDIPKRPPDALGKDAPRPAIPPGGGSATPRPVSPGDNAVYRIDADGVAREIFRAKVLVFALALRGHHLFVGTGPEGQIYEIRDRGHESSPVARLDNGQVLALLDDPDGGILVGTGDPGSVVRLDPGYVASGTLTSDVRDTKLISRFGAVSWRADRPKGATVSVQVRSGNVSEPDATWSDWSTPQTDPDHAQAQVPPGRFVQYRVTLATSDPTATPELHGVTVRYQSANLAPEIAKLDVPDVSALDGTTRQTRLTFRWDVNDPNDDELEYHLYLRKDGWPDWVKLNEQPLSEKTFPWDTTSVPSGHYRARVSASDRPSNNPDDALGSEKVSETFLVDHDAPSVAFDKSPGALTVTLKDRLTRITRASYAVDGGDWVPVFPKDGLFDTPEETVSIPLADLKPGTHVIVVRATDAAGNVGTGDTLLGVPKQP